VKITRRHAGGHKTKTHLSTLIENEINDSHSPEDKQRDILANLIEVLATKKIISLDDIASDILQLSNDDGDEIPILTKDEF
jgi:hypothetical protein